jgi:predicted phosphoribosyltransferase
MYFSSRTQAGRMLASQLSKKYSSGNTVIVALNDGGVVVGLEIAKKLNCTVSLLLSSEITLPRELAAIAGITSTGEFSFNEEYAPSEVEEMASEYRNFIEQEKLEKMHDLNHFIGRGGTINYDIIKGKNVILVADGLKSGFLLDLAYQYLKPIAIEKIVAALPLAAVPAVDRMHVLCDEIYCLSVVDQYEDTNHYFDSNDVPDHEEIVKTIEQIIAKLK